MAIFFLLALVTAAAGADDTVRVLLAEEERPLVFSSVSPVVFSTGAETIYLNHPKSEIKTEFVRGQWVIHVTTKTHKENYSLSGGALSVKSATLQWNQQKLEFPIIISARTKYSLVGVMSMNTYLSGVVEHEMPGGWPLEALKAQAVASRTYALWKKRSQKNDVYDLRPSVLDQVFRLTRSHESSSLHPSIEEALRATDDVYLVDANNRILKAYFHSDCGGATSSAQEVWGQTGSGHNSARDVACEKRSSDWTSRWSQQKLAQQFSREFILPPNLTLLNVEVRVQSASQRVEWVDLIFSKGIFKRVRGEDMRRVLGYDKLKSTMFAVEKQSDGWVFNGRGFGHGVGMCQHGARAMAKAGSDYRTILKHYYPESVLKQGNDNPRFKSSVSSLIEFQ